MLDFDQHPMFNAEQFRAGNSGPHIAPVLPLRDVVAFPDVAVSLQVGRESSLHALAYAQAQARKRKQLQETAAANDDQTHDREPTKDPKGLIFLLTQKQASVEDPKPDDLHAVGTIAEILQLLKFPDGTYKILVRGLARARVSRLERQDDFFQATVLPHPFEEDEPDPVYIQALTRSLLTHLREYVERNRKLSDEKKKQLKEIFSKAGKMKDPENLANLLAGHLPIGAPESQKLLERPSLRKYLEHLLAWTEGEIDILQMQKRIRKRVKDQLEKTQREYYLNEQMRAIQKELGEDETGRGEMAEMDERIKKIKLSEEANAKARSELKKLRQMSPVSAEAAVVRNYLDWLLAIPWGKRKRVRKDLHAAERILDEDHYGLEKVKERILEYLAVQQRVGKLRGPILCLVGPPGVGKTSLGKSIARATGREFVRMSLGGVRDEAEIRGHRRTYIGSLPGKVIQSMRKATCVNPLFLLDEIDKIGVDFRGDPAAALLEVLDPEQNATFADHYLEVDYDLSNVLFLTTANSLNIPPALVDRMEIIRIGGYTEEEKVEIARRHLLQKSMRAHGLKEGEFTLEDDALRALIRVYTREAGVRSLEREINALARKSVRRLIASAPVVGSEKDEAVADEEAPSQTPETADATADAVKEKAGAKKKAKATAAAKPPETIKVTADDLEDFLGVPKFRRSVLEEGNRIGVVTGLAWTEFGGEILTIEGVMLPGKGKMVVTGNLRDVMKESISAANSYVKARAAEFGIEPPAFDKRDIHVHVPEGATPKDGPSAGVAMAVAIVSVMTGIPPRREVAMTGEITLRGRILPIGGLKEKLLAATRDGAKTVLIPEENARDLAEIPESVKERLDIRPVSTMDEALEVALERMPEPIAWDEAAYAAQLADKTPTTHPH